jgi:hypothetical protein
MCHWAGPRMDRLIHSPDLDIEGATAKDTLAISFPL